MLRSQKRRTTTENKERCFGLRIESNSLQLAIATQLSDERFRLEIDSISSEVLGGWLIPANADHLTEALKALVERHEIGNQPVAVSLDGDFCVTRVAMGTVDKVDKELSSLAVRVPRYLQLGPGEKVTGNARSNIAPAIDYAVTGVVNRTLIQLIYESLRANELNVSWVEPSLVSVARMLGRARVGGDRPILIADGSGKQWDVGIACSGRLLLDYRPASATTVESLRDAVEGHLSRLQRFCQRYRGIATGELQQLLICGNESKTAQTQEVLGKSMSIEALAMKVPQMEELYEIDERFRDSSCVPSVATVLPLLIGVPASEVPDLLHEVRREPDIPFASRFLRSGWSAIAAALVLAITYGLVSGQRHRLAGTVKDREQIEAQLQANEVRFSNLSQKRDRLTHLAKIRRQSQEPNWSSMFTNITKSLPDTAKLNSFQVDGDGSILLNGTVTNESQVFELVNDFRHLPLIAQVALRGTSPDEEARGTRFMIRLVTSLHIADSETGSPDE